MPHSHDRLIRWGQLATFVGVLASPVSGPQAQVAEPAAAMAVTSSAVPAALPLPAEQPRTPALSQRLLDWVAAWSSKDVPRYIAFYGDDFKPTTTSRAKWAANRTRLLNRPEPIEIRIENVQRHTLSPNLVRLVFDQHYRAGATVDDSRKTLLWKRVRGQWVIIRESNR